MGREEGEVAASGGVPGELRRVLLMEDDPDTARVVRLYLESASHEIVQVATLRDALRRLESEAFDAVIADLSLPDSRGGDTFHAILTHAPDTALVVLTATRDDALGIEAVRAGAQEYILKHDLDPRLLQRSLHFAVERARMRADLRDQALRDPLTGLLNRRGFLVLGESQLRLARREGRSALVAFTDADGFKAINDTYGHEAGDRALQRIAAGLQRAFRDSDVVARLGGDEFVTFATSSQPQHPEAVAQRIRRCVGQAPRGPDDFPLELSVGVVAVDPAETPAIEALLALADRAMYDDKRARQTRSDAS
jgi:diguanylate cyclase (GGDEF)-like protein